MRRTAVFLLLPITLCGCLFDVRTGDTVLPESPARHPLREKIVAQIEKQLTRDEWTGTVVTKTVVGSVSTSRNELWSEDRIDLDVAAKAPDDTPLRIPVNDYVAILKGVRPKQRDLVEDAGGQQLDWTVNETFRERSLTFQYRSGSVVGWVLLRMFPKSDQPDELLTRIEITIHEQPAPAQ